jgi:tRNA threonylcarbamoyl adenosine modification protein YeaZ
MIAVGIGPGSYTGIRISLSAAIGISMARHVPVVPIPSACALVHAAAEERYAVCGDARRGSWWWAEVQRGRLAGPPVVGSPEEIASLAARSFCRIYTPDDASPPFCEATPSWPRADIVAQRAASLTNEELVALADIPPEPIYLRPPFITLSRKPAFLPAPNTSA